MQRRSSKFLLMLLTFIILFSTVAAAPFEAKSLTLLDVRFIHGVGIVLLFDSTGLTQRDIRTGTADVHSNSHKMSCGFKDDTQVVRCVINGTLTQYAGENFSGELAGFAFFGIIPELKEPAPICPDQQVLWVVVSVYQYGELVDGPFEIPAEFYDSFVAFISAIYEGTATVEVTDTHCGENLVLEEPQGPV